MSIIELIQAVGLENIRVQYLDQTTEAMDYSKKKGGTTVRFITTEITVDDLLSGKPKKCGMVIWFDRELYPKPSATPECCSEDAPVEQETK